MRDRPERYRLRSHVCNKREEIERLLTAYEADVRFPEASGMEVLDMLLKRSEIAHADHARLLTGAQRRRRAEARRVLALQARHFSAALQHIADLDVWHQHEGAPPKEWRRHPDVPAHTPVIAADDAPVPA